jgi:hypothetical protein
MRLTAERGTSSIVLRTSALRATWQTIACVRQYNAEAIDRNVESRSSTAYKRMCCVPADASATMVEAWSTARRARWLSRRLHEAAD